MIRKLHCYLCSVYADDKTFFLQDTISVKYMVQIFRLRPNLLKSENAGIGVLKVERGSSGSLCYRLYNLNNNTLKILGTHFSYNEKLKEEKNLMRL